MIMFVKIINCIVWNILVTILTLHTSVISQAKSIAFVKGYLQTLRLKTKCKNKMYKILFVNCKYHTVKN